MAIIAEYKKFEFKNSISDEELAFYDRYGFIHYKHFLSPEQVALLNADIDQAQQTVIADNKSFINGIPIKFGKDEHQRAIVQRFPFTNVYAKTVQQLFEEERLKKIHQFIPAKYKKYPTRIGLTEKDGVVTNYFINTPHSAYKQLGWHTDVLRDFFMGKKMYPMINVGVYLTNSGFANGGLRILPSTHRQSVMSMLFRKTQVLNKKEDPDEIMIEAEAGDLCLHEGRMWHRVALAPDSGTVSRRRVMYVPLLCGPPDVRTEKSPTPLYHYLGKYIKFN